MADYQVNSRDVGKGIHCIGGYVEECIRYGIPRYMGEGLYSYFEHRCRPGDFLGAVLINDLVGAVRRADGENIHALRAYICFLSNRVPADSWGSEGEVRDWLKGKHQVLPGMPTGSTIDDIASVMGSEEGRE